MAKKEKNQLFRQFFESEKAGGLTLIFFTLVSLIVSNSSFGEHYFHFWESSVGGMSVEQWVNDALMAVFFLLIGLELKHEFKDGELSSFKTAALPGISAIGGMLVPAAFYIFFNAGQTSEHGFGIPMATDIAFALGILSLLGDRVPLSLKVFLTALAVIDDLGAVLVIAIFYTQTIYWIYLAVALGLFVAMLILNKMKVTNLLIYLPFGIAMWYCMHHSGVHATIAGVLFAFALPSFQKGKAKNPSELLQKWLHYPVPFIILPLFALANTAVLIGDDWQSSFSEPVGLGILIGLVLGKPIGIVLFAFLAVLLKVCALPSGVKWKQLLGAGILGGIGFTMSIFVTILAFDHEKTIASAKFCILISSLVAAILGLVWLYLVLPSPKKKLPKKA